MTEINNNPNSHQIVCSICGFIGKDHDDLYDCVEYHEEKNGIRKGQWMVDWSRRLKEKEKKKEPFSGFKAWSKKHS